MDSVKVWVQSSYGLGIIFGLMKDKALCITCSETLGARDRDKASLATLLPRSDFRHIFNETLFWKLVVSGRIAGPCERARTFVGLSGVIPDEQQVQAAIEDGITQGLMGLLNGIERPLGVLYADSSHHCCLG